MQFENEVHKSRVKQQAAHIELLERKVTYYMEQQSLFSLMRSDIEKYKSAYQKSVKEGTLYSPFTATKQFKQEQQAIVA